MQIQDFSVAGAAITMGHRQHCGLTILFLLSTVIADSANFEFGEVGSGQIIDNTVMTDLSILNPAIENSVVQDPIENEEASSTEELNNVFVNVSDSREINVSYNNSGFLIETRDKFENDTSINFNATKYRTTLISMTNLSNEDARNDTKVLSLSQDSDISENKTAFVSENSTTFKTHIDEYDIFKQPFDDDSFNSLLNISLSTENETNYDEVLNPPTTHNQIFDEQADSPITGVQLTNNSTESEENFEKVFNISTGNNEEENGQIQRDQIIVESNDTSNGIIPQSYGDLFEVYHFSNNPNSGNKTLADNFEEIFLNKLPKNKTSTVVHAIPPEDDVSDVEPIYIRRGDIDIARAEDYDDYEPIEDNRVTTPDENQTAAQFGEEDNKIPTHVKIDFEEEEKTKTQIGVSLAIVFDITGSMLDDLMQVRLGAARIMAAMLERPDNPIYNYVLVPFHDPRKYLYY